LVAPQLWAWGGWRIAKLRRRTDLVLCLLPFEPEWFRSRGVSAVFIGHPVMERRLDIARLDADALRLPVGTPRIALLPGSRRHELHANLRALVDSFALLRHAHPQAACVLVAANENLRRLAQQIVPAMPDGLHVQVGGLDGVLHWCDLALNVSGTVSLDIALHAKPMVGIYRISAPSLAVSSLLLRSPVRLLPNIIAGRKIVPEFVPTTAGPEAFAAAADGLLRSSQAAQEARSALEAVARRFAGHDSGFEAAALIDHVSRGGSTEAGALDSVVAASHTRAAAANCTDSP
jgi:lipid-A-disaccharide synthase